MDRLDEQTMTVSIAQVPRPFRVISKEQGKKEYGMPYYVEEVGRALQDEFRRVAYRIRREGVDLRTAREWVKEAMTRVGVEPVEKPGWTIQLMRFKSPGDLADALYDMTYEVPGTGVGVVVGEGKKGIKNLKKMWEVLGEKERIKLLERAGYTEEEVEAYKKFDWDNLPPAVRSRVEVVMEGVYEAYNPGAAEIRVPFHKRGEFPEGEEPSEGEVPLEEPSEEEGSEEGETLKPIFEEFKGWFRKMSGLVETEGTGVSPEDPKILELVARAKEGDKKAGEELWDRYKDAIRAIAVKVARKLGMPYTDVEELESLGASLFWTEVIPKYDPMKAKLSTFLGVVLTNLLTQQGMKLARGRGFGIPEEEEKPSPVEMAKALASAEEMPKQCVKKLMDLVAKLPEKERMVIELRFGLLGEKPLGLREVGEKIGVSHQTVLNWEKRAIERLLDMPESRDVWVSCRDYLERETSEDLEREELELWGTELEWELPGVEVAENMEYVLVLEGVKVRRKGRKVTIPVNEYARMKKAFERFGLTVPKRMVVKGREEIRRMMGTGEPGFKSQVSSLLRDGIKTTE